MSESANQELTHRNLAKRTHEIMEGRAIRDGLTGAYNRRYLNQRLDALTSYGEGVFSIFMVDIDHFKAVNDNYGGHSAGDELLKGVYRVLDNHIRPNSNGFVARYGGDEICVVIPGIDKVDLALARAEELRKSVAEANFRVLQGNLKSTISVGVAIWNGKEDKIKLLHRVDKALYKAKRSGRNRVEKA